MDAVKIIKSSLPKVSNMKPATRTFFYENLKSGSIGQTIPISNVSQAIFYAVGVGSAFVYTNGFQPDPYSHIHDKKSSSNMSRYLTMVLYPFSTCSTNKTSPGERSKRLCFNVKVNFSLWWTFVEIRYDRET